MENLRPKILVTVINQGWVRSEMIQTCFLMASDPRAQIVIAPMEHKIYENNLNGALKMAREGKYDFLITFDHDNVPVGNPIDLAFLGKDIIGMPYLSYQYSPSGEIELGFLSMDKVEKGYRNHKNVEGLQEVDAIASGALLLSKKVIDSGIYFEREWKEGFAEKGVDFYFCEKAKGAGFKVHAHYGYLAEHYKEIPLLRLK